MWIFCYHSRGPAGDLGSGKWEMERKVRNGMEQKDQPRIYWSSYLYRRVVLLVDRIYSNEDYDIK